VYFVGIDLAWSPRNRSGAAVLSTDGKLPRSTSTLGSDADITAFVADTLPPGTAGLVAIDAPLAVPNQSGGRACDRQVASVFGRFQAAPYPVNRRNLARYGGLRGETITQQLRSLGFRLDPNIAQKVTARQVVEVFPHPATVSLFDLDRTLKYKARAGRDYPLRWSELTRLRHCLAALAGAEPSLCLTPDIAEMRIEGRKGRAFKEAEDLLDAVICAYSVLYAWYHGPRGYAVYGNASDGHILVPLTPAMRGRIKLQSSAAPISLSEGRSMAA
jgi:predicted RNase H-like nuclease